MANTPYVLTYCDLLDRCQDFLGGNTSLAGLRDLRAAIQDAIREVATARSTTYLKARHRIRFDDDYSTGTVAYDHTGGTYERQLTLSSGTWPTNALYGEVTIDNVSYELEDKKSSTVVTLPASNNPGADVASGTSYSWARSVYPLPSNFAKLLAWEMENNVGISYVTPGELLNARVLRTSPGSPLLFTIRGDENLVGSLALEVSPAPDSATSIELVYERRPRRLRIDGKQTAHTQGTISTTADSTAVSGSGTAFAASHVGCIIRIGEDATNIPTELGGAFPYLEERVIVARTSATAITLDAAAENTQSGVKYVVSDPLDMNESMYNALFRCIEWQLALKRRAKDAPNLEQNYRRALVMAAEADTVLRVPRYCGDGVMASNWRPADAPGS